MRKLLFLIAMSVSFSSFSQTDDIKKKFEEYNMKADFLTENLKDADAQHSFNFKITTVTSQDTKVETGKFDVTKPVGQRWILLKVNGGTPSKKDLKNFDKAHNTKQDNVNGKVDDNSWKIEKDDDEYFVISFKYDKNTLPKKYDFLGDCTGKAYFNKKSERLEKAEFANDKPLKIKIFKVNELDMFVNYTYNEESKTYLISKENLDMKANILGQVIDIKEITEYSDYTDID